MRRSLFVLIIVLASLTAAAPTLSWADSEYDAALNYYYNGKYEEAMKYLKEYVERKPDPAAYYLIGYSLYKLGRFKEANGYFEEAYFIDPDFSPEKSGLTEKFPKGKWEVVRKPLVHKGRAAAMKKKRVAVAAAKQQVTPEGKKEVSRAPSAVTQPPKGTQPKKAEKPVAAAGKTALQPEVKKTAPAKPIAQAQKSVPPATEIQNKRSEKTKEATPEKKASPTAQKAEPQGQQPPAGLPSRSLTPKDVKTVLPVLAIPMVMGGLMAGFTFVFLAIGMAFYLYFSLCLFLIARKLNVAAPWTAWIPLVQVWTLVTSAGKPWWWILLLLIPILNILVIIYLWMCISENLGRNKWLGLLWLLPIVNLVFISVLAFSKTERTAGADVVESTHEDIPPADQEDEF